MEKVFKWEEYLHLVEFAYNDGHQSPLGMIMFKSLYVKECRTPVSWNSLVRKVVLGLEVI